MVNKPLKLPGVGQYIQLEVDQEVMEVTSSYRCISVPLLHLNIFMELNLFLFSSTLSPTFCFSSFHLNWRSPGKWFLICRCSL